ncbi:ABC transporter permease [Devosia sp. SL43]|uniref:ABC transporter permease n=1 Tax=Devosia sp. SL43 TaxID=2806348 RepID=UPI001F28D61A|nr:ABC transporter permease [Devosia sp. SL43]UJW85649.1 ABC transporter permease [Devosia sp. SL43]
MGYLRFALKRVIQLFAVLACGISAAFFISHLSPIDPVEQAMTQVTSRGNFSAAAADALRATLTELYGTDRPLMDQFISFWSRLVRGDFGPSLMAFPTPAMDLVMRALPWTVGLLTVATVINWVVGNLLGALAGYYQDSKILKAVGIVAVGAQPIPYYVFAFVLLIIFGLVWPVLPISDGFAMNVRPGWNLPFVLSILHHSILPAASLVLVGFGGWFLGMRALVSNIITEDYVTYAEIAGVSKNRIVYSYIFRNAAVPQLTALAMALGGVFGGAIITEQVFSYPGLGSLLIQAVNRGDFGLVLAVSSVSIIAVAVSIFVIDLLYPIIDPRVRAE